MKKKQRRIWWANGYCWRIGTNARIFVHELTDVYRGEGDGACPTATGLAHRCAKHLIKILDLRDSTRMRLGGAIHHDPSLSFRASRRVPPHESTNTRKIYSDDLIATRANSFLVSYIYRPFLFAAHRQPAWVFCSAFQLSGNSYPRPSLCTPNSMKICSVLWISL